MGKDYRGMSLIKMLGMSTLAADKVCVNPGVTTKHSIDQNYCYKRSEKVVIVV